MDAFDLLAELVVIPGPPGAEDEVRRAVGRHVRSIGGLQAQTDAKGNLIVPLHASSDRPKVVVTAHLDEIAMIVKSVSSDGRLKVASLGGLFPWKLGEGPVVVLGSKRHVPGVLSFGSIHTEDAGSVVQKARDLPLGWTSTHVFTGLTGADLAEAGVRPGTRVCVAPSRRYPFELGQYVSAHFLDDRADLVAWLLALDELSQDHLDAVFVATAAEEVGGEGALVALHELRPEVCVALELGANVPDAPVEISAAPTVWVNDSYSAIKPGDMDLLVDLAHGLTMDLQFQAFSRGGSDASCAASRGLCSRPITLGIPMENSHGYEIMHRDAPVALARLTVALVRQLCGYPYPPAHGPV